MGRVRCDVALHLRVGGRRVVVEKNAGCRDVVGAAGAGKEPVVADAVEAFGQHMHQEAPDELVRVKPHGLPAVLAADAIVLPAERNGPVVGCNEAAVRDGNRSGRRPPTSPLRPFWPRGGPGARMVLTCRHGGRECGSNERAPHHRARSYVGPLEEQRRVSAETYVAIIAFLASRGTRADRCPRKEPSHANGLSTMRGREFYLAIGRSAVLVGYSPDSE